MWGIVGFGLAPGSCPYGRTPGIPEILEISRKNPENPENYGKSETSRNLHVTYQIKALGKLVHMDILNFRNSGKVLKKD